MKPLVWIASRNLILMTVMSACYLAGAQDIHTRASVTIPFGVTNQNVNAAIIRAYESDRSIWQESQLYLVATCYMFSNDLTNATAVLGRLANSTNADRLLRGRAECALGSVYLLQRDTSSAESHFAAAWKTYRYLPALANLAELYASLDDFKRYEKIWVCSRICGSFSRHFQFSRGFVLTV